MKLIKIYTLSHPITKEIRYVGYTTMILENRLKLHINHAKVRKPNHRINWINSLPSIPLIEEVDSGFYEDRIWLEIMYISLFKSWGFKLVNGTIGGDGGDTFSKLSLDRQKIFREKCSAASKKRKVGPLQGEHLEKCRNHLSKYREKIKSGEVKHPTTGFIPNFETRRKMSLAKVGLSSNRSGKSIYGEIAMIDVNNNEILKIFQNPIEASKYIGKKTTNIIKTARGEHKTAYGFKWKFM